MISQLPFRAWTFSSFSLKKTNLEDLESKILLIFWGSISMICFEAGSNSTWA